MDVTLEIYDLIQDISWYFGNQGFDGECCEDLSLVEYMALKKVCATKAMKIQDIGTEINICKSGVSKVIDRLEEKNYASREHSPKDGRVCCVQATKKGLDAVKKISTRYSEYLTEALINEKQTSLFNLRDVLKMLNRAIREKGFLKIINENRRDIA